MAGWLGKALKARSPTSSCCCALLSNMASMLEGYRSPSYFHSPRIVSLRLQTFIHLHMVNVQIGISNLVLSPELQTCTSSCLLLIST